MTDKPSVIGSFRTKTGTKYHRDSCRFAKGSTKIEKPEDALALKPCATCKPHLPAGMVPIKSIGKEITLTTCQVCMKGEAHGIKTKAVAEAEGYLVTKTGLRYHAAVCRYVGGPGVRRLAAVSVKAEPKAPVAVSVAVAPKASASALKPIKIAKPMVQASL